jgi:hypothetical protein
VSRKLDLYAIGKVIHNDLYNGHWKNRRYAHFHYAKTYDKQSERPYLLVLARRRGYAPKVLSTQAGRRLLRLPSEPRDRACHERPKHGRARPERRAYRGIRLATGWLAGQERGALKTG